MICACEHRALSHAYRTTEGNAGRCLSPGCTCTAYEKRDD